MKIKCVKAREILDSRGTPTVEAEIVLESGLSATASVLLQANMRLWS